MNSVLFYCNDFRESDCSIATDSARTQAAGSACAGASAKTAVGWAATVGRSAPLRAVLRHSFRPGHMAVAIARWRLDGDGVVSRSAMGIVARLQRDELSTVLLQLSASGLNYPVASHCPVADPRRQISSDDSTRCGRSPRRDFAVLAGRLTPSHQSGQFLTTRGARFRHCAEGVAFDGAHRQSQSLGNPAVGQSFTYQQCDLHLALSQR